MAGLLILVACSDKPAEETAPAPAPASAPWEVAVVKVQPVPGMVWVDGGVLIAGTPPEKMPRVADAEMAGEQVVMNGFYIDVFSYPNERGAIPKTNVTQAEAQALCQKQDKRLCTELEWERACKGPDNLTYPYGERYQAASCGTDAVRFLVPSGIHAACESQFGMRDPHGGIFNWTASPWGRGKDEGKVTVRGGNGSPGELFGRCANAQARPPAAKTDEIGFRCCKGEPNHFEVVISVQEAEPLRWQPPDKRIAPMLTQLMPDGGLDDRVGELEGDAPNGGSGFTIERMWIWHPLGNEELVIGGGCGSGPADRKCGVVIARMKQSKPTPLAYVATERWQPTLGQADTPRELFVFGGDDNGAFRKRVGYDWGKISIGEKEHKKRRKGQKHATYD